MKKYVYLFIIILTVTSCTTKLSKEVVGENISDKVVLYYQNEDFDKIIDLNHKHDNKIEQAIYINSLFNSGRYQSILDIFEEDIKTKKQFIDIYGLILMQQGNFRQSINILKNIKYDKDYRVLAAKALAYTKIKNLSKANYYFKMAINKTPVNKIIKLAAQLLIAGDYKNADILASKAYNYSKLEENKVIIAKIRLLSNNIKGYKELTVLHHHYNEIEKTTAWPYILNYLNIKADLKPAKNISFQLARSIENKNLNIEKQQDSVKDYDAYNE